MLISAGNEQQSRKGADTDQLKGRRLAAEVLVVVFFRCHMLFYCRWETNGEGNNDSRSETASANTGTKMSFTEIPFQVKIKITLVVPEANAPV